MLYKRRLVIEYWYIRNTELYTQLNSCPNFKDKPAPQNQYSSPPLIMINSIFQGRTVPTEFGHSKPAPKMPYVRLGKSGLKVCIMICVKILIGSC